MSSNPKISIIGAGNVGASAAYRALELDFCDVVLLDIVEAVSYTHLTLPTNREV